MGVRVGVLTLYPAGGPYICVGFFLWWRSCVSSPAGGGVGSY